MSTIRNNVKLIGRLGKDPEVRTLEKGNKVASFTMATSDKFTDKDGKLKEQTEWHTIVAWGNLAERCEKFLKKGKEVAVDGKLTYRSWEDKNGSKHYTTEVMMNDMLLVGTKPEEKKD